MYTCIVAWLTVPAVEQKYDRVHIEGSVSREGNSRRNAYDVTPLHSLTTAAPLSVGQTRTIEMDVVRLDGEREYVPSFLRTLRLNEHAAACRHVPYKDRTPPSRAPDEMVDHEMHTMLIAPVLMGRRCLFHAELYHILDRSPPIRRR